MRHFRGSILFTLAALACAGALGFYYDHTLSGALKMLWIAAVLGIMETSLSLDNAVVNATVLKTMAPVWQRMFLTVGILIAVFGMRVVFPLLIVAVAGHISPLEALNVAIQEPKRYEQIIIGAHVGISGFGGAFLALVGLGFFFDTDKDIHWARGVEGFFSTLGGFRFAPYVVAGFLVLGLSALQLRGGGGQTFFLAGAMGMAAHFAVQKLGDLMQVPDDAEKAVVRAGLGAFLYLEMLDASFSFDGVIGAFALSNNIFLIALGLGIGAMFVRSMTIYLVQRDSLGEYRYLEHGAFWAILVLSGIMLAAPLARMPEAVTGLVGAVLIGSALWASIRYNRLHPEEVEDGTVVLPSGDYIPNKGEKIVS